MLDIFRTVGKVVFDDGEIWDATNGVTCKISQKQIQVPEEVVGKVKKELEKYFNNVNLCSIFSMKKVKTSGMYVWQDKQG